LEIQPPVFLVFRARLIAIQNPPDIVQGVADVDQLVMAAEKIVSKAKEDLTDKVGVSQLDNFTASFHFG
jgi:hypothetical protein